MVLEKPQDEECGNCYFCTSQTMEYFEPRGFLEIPTKKKGEQFGCHRNPPQFGWVGEYHGSRIVLHSSTFPQMSSKNWCGEWRQRK